MRADTSSAASTSTVVRRWSITSISNWCGRWPKTTLALSVPIILALCLNSAEPDIPADYKAYFDALSAYASGRYTEAVESTDKVFRHKPESPLTGKAAVTAARAWLAMGQGREAAAILQKHKVPQPEGGAVLGEALEAAGEPVSAAGAWQRVYYEHPLSDEAAQAEAALLRLASTLGERFPPVMPQVIFDRAEKLRRGGQGARAKAELLAAASSFAGPDRDIARVRANAGNYAALSALTVADADAEAERLYRLHASARSASQDARAEAALTRLEKAYPKSVWTMEALISWGNHHLLRNNVTEYEPRYAACAERFESDYCQWKAAWAAWINRRPDARSRLQAYVTKFPRGEKASAALYFLGRYSEVVSRFPMSWYAVLAREKGAAAPARGLRAEHFTPTPSLTQRIKRARTLESANLHEWAEFELRFAANEQPFVAAMELAEVAAGRGAHDQALRYIKGVAKGYLSLSLEEGPERFWRLAFPLPYRAELEENSRRRGLDPFLVAALIRQESEFNPRAVSAAKAYGLTQVLPSTARSIYRRVGAPEFHTSMLFDPEYNLRLGTYYLRTMLDSHGGREEVTLASYNAGKSRSDLWLSWYEYREPAEFVETIPFTETRNYVQVVLRNADVYRRLYGSQRRGTSAD
jgi:soluble lytic murein transglycosylase